MTNHPNRGTAAREMAQARKTADRMAKAIEQIKGVPARFAHTYAQAVNRSTGEIKVVAYYDGDSHEEVFTLTDAVRACDYFERGGPIRVSVISFLDSQSMPA